ncbi:MAG: cell division initiation protein [Actinomycetota bacterium]|jgi:DivIVA domain-containing protein|nr:cell division initiation protein [Actinomycetota bacterium]
MDSQAIREVVFREKLRGYHPDDVDAFVASVAETVAGLEARVAEAEARASGPADTEDSLRRTLVLAQRTADLAIEEARQEAARMVEEARSHYDALQRDAAELKARLHAEAEEEARAERDRLHAERAALLADLAALDEHLARERERLHIYFSDQLRRVEEGEPGLTPTPEMQAPEAVAEPAIEVAIEPPAAEDEPPVEGHADDDPFLAELRRAVTDEEPLGPRDEPLPDADDDAFDLFAPGEEEVGRFGSRLRRRR